MKKLVIFVVLLSIAAGARAQIIDFSLNSQRVEAGLNFGQAASFTDYARLALGASVNICGVYVDYLKASPQHRYADTISDEKWDDTCAFCINAGYQFPIVSWLRIMPLLGYAQTNEGVTDGSSLRVESTDDSFNLYHPYKVTPGTRTHYFNYGGGLSIQPCKWFSINLIATRNALYGGIALDMMSFTE